jgi:hypothetical protein
MGKGKPDATVAFSAIASPLVDSAVEQARHIAQAPAVEGIHQLRVTLRSLLTLWWFYRPLMEARKYALQRSSLKSIACAAGMARDYDILIELLRRNDKCSAADIAAYRPPANPLCRLAGKYSHPSRTDMLAGSSGASFRKLGPWSGQPTASSCTGPGCTSSETATPTHQAGDHRRQARP